MIGILILLGIAAVVFAMADTAKVISIEEAELDVAIYEDGFSAVWPEFMKNIEEQFGFDLQGLVFDNVKVEVTAVDDDGTLVDCTIGG